MPVRHHVDVADDEDWRRLAGQVTERRTALGLTQEDVRDAGGPSTATMRLIEGALQTSYRPMIMARLEKALRWAPGSVQAILDGGKPVETNESGLVTRQDSRRDRVEALIQEIYDELPEDIARNIVLDIRRMEADREARLRAAEDELAAYRRRKAQRTQDEGGPAANAGHA